MTDAERRAALARHTGKASSPDEPDDPLVVLERWRGDDLAHEDAYELLAAVNAAHRQLRELHLEAAWQRSFGWFVARSVVVFGMLVIFGLAVAPQAVTFETIVAALIGVGLFYLVIVVTAPLRLRRHRRIRSVTLARYRAALDTFTNNERASGGV